MGKKSKRKSLPETIEVAQLDSKVVGGASTTTEEKDRGQNDASGPAIKNISETSDADFDIGALFKAKKLKTQQTKSAKEQSNSVPGPSAEDSSIKKV